jgi:type III pantothenate kinase
MILLLDQGNSRLKWVLVREDGGVCLSGVVVNELCVVDEMKRLLPTLTEPVSAVHVSFVAGEIRRRDLEGAVRTVFGVHPSFCQASVAFRTLRNGYVNSTQLGVDRWMAMVGAWSGEETALLVVDVGTALTVDAVSADGMHLGGGIVPGVRLQRKSLGINAAMVESSAGQGCGVSWGRDTAGAITCGIWRSLAALVDAAADELANNSGGGCRVVLTGGDADALASHLRVPFSVDEFLVFRGIWATVAPAGPPLLPA